jgi:tRNA(adenine34) deaminase
MVPDPSDFTFMEEALGLARHAATLGEVPVGAVAVHGGQIVGRGYNRRELDRDPFAHAEIRALGEAAKFLGAWRLTDISLYVTLEPCAMCAGAMVQGRLSRLIYGAMDPKAGAVGSLYDLCTEPRHNHRVEVTRGVREAACSQVLKDFFRGLRERRTAQDTTE